MMASHYEIRAEKNFEKMIQKPNLDRMAQQVQNLFKFRNFYE